MAWRGPGEELPPGIRGETSELDAVSSRRGRGGGPLRGSSFQGAPTPDALEGYISIPPPELALYPGARNLYGEGESAAIVNGTSAIVGEIQLMEGNVGVINSLIIYGVNLVVGLAATFELLVNGSVQLGGTRKMPPQNSASASLAWGPQEILFRIPQGAEIAVKITVAAGGPARLGAQFSGWEYPASLERFSSSWRE